MSHRLTELLVNGGFEKGVLAPWTIVAGTAVVTTGKRAFSGSFTAVLGPNSTIQQVIPRGLKEKRVYRFNGALADDLTTSSIDQPENPTTTVRLQFIDKRGVVLHTVTKIFNRLTLPEMGEGNYRWFTILEIAPEDTAGAIVSISTAADGFIGVEGIVVDEFSLIQENND